MGEIDGAFRAWGIPKGGTGGVSNAIGAAARALGAEIRLESPVERINVKGGRAVGVALAGSGEELHADVVLSSLDARRTFLSLLEPGSLDAEFEAEVLGAEQPVLVEFWAQWCGPCHMLSPVLDEIDRERDDLTVLKINADENTATARDYQVMSLPTMLLFRDGVPIRQIVGARPKSRLLAELDDALSA